MLTAIGILILCFGVGLMVVGAYGVIENLRTSWEEKEEPAARGLAGQEDLSGGQTRRSLVGSLELQASAYEAERMREERRAGITKGISYVLTGIIFVMAGLAVFYNNRTLSDRRGSGVR